MTAASHHHEQVHYEEALPSSFPVGDARISVAAASSARAASPSIIIISI